MSSLLPVAWVKGGRIEKKVISEHKKLAGTSDIDAKVLYVKLARGLPTFGVHFFLVKVRETDERGEFGDEYITAIARSRVASRPSVLRPRAAAVCPAPGFSADVGT